MSTRKTKVKGQTLEETWFLILIKGREPSLCDRIDQTQDVINEYLEKGVKIRDIKIYEIIKQVHFSIKSNLVIS